MVSLIIIHFVVMKLLICVTKQNESSDPVGELYGNYHQKFKLSLLLSQSHDDQNMQPFSHQTLSSSCIVSSHPLHGPPSNNSYSFVHLMLYIHLGIWDYLLTSHLRHLQCCHHWCSQLQAEFDVGSQGWMVSYFKTLHAVQEDSCMYRYGICLHIYHWHGNKLYHICMYNRLPEDVPLGLKHAEDIIKIKILA